MDPKRQRFFLDNHLKRHVKAVTQLYNMGEEIFDEMYEYTVKHELYKEVLALCRYNEQHQKEILRLYSRYLESKANYKEAALGKLASLEVEFKSDGRLLSIRISWFF